MSVTIVYSCHADTDRENIGDVLSGRGIARLGQIVDPDYCVVPRDSGSRIQPLTIYGGGGMIRPRFAEKEVYQDFLTRKDATQYHIYGVGLNQDVDDVPISDADRRALGAWFSRAKSVTVRESASLTYVQETFGIAASVAPCPSYSILKTMVDPKPTVRFSLGIVPSFGHTLTSRHYMPKTVELIQTIVDAFGLDTIQFICHDQADADFARATFGLKTHVFIPKDFSDIPLAYQSCAAVVTFRAHGIIFSSAMGVPVTPVALSNKATFLYEYHYGQLPLELTFDWSAHQNWLAKNIMPKNIETITPSFLSPHA